MNTETTMPATATTIAEYSATAAALASLSEKYAKVHFDVSTPAGMKSAIAGRAELRDLRVALEKKRKEIKEPALQRAREIDTEAKRITAVLTSLEDPIDAQIKAEDARKAAEKAERERIEAERVAAIRAKIDGIRNLPAASFRDNATDLAATLQDLTDFAITDEDFAELQAEAVQVRHGAMGELRQLLDNALAAEAEAERVATERAELERQQAEQAERERVAAAERKAAQDTLDAERAAFEAERAAFAEQQAAAAKAEEERLAKLAAEQQERDQVLLQPATIEQPAVALADVAAAVLPEPLAAMVAEPAVDTDSKVVDCAFEPEANDNAAPADPRGANWPLPSFDARDWAQAFMELFGDRRDEIDEGLMITWFANALMRGFEEHARQQEAA